MSFISYFSFNISLCVFIFSTCKRAVYIENTCLFLRLCTEVKPSRIQGITNRKAISISSHIQIL